MSIYLSLSIEIGIYSDNMREKLIPKGSSSLVFFVNFSISIEAIEGYYCGYRNCI